MNKDAARKFAPIIRSMNRYLAILALLGTLFLGACANDLTAEDTGDRPPAPYAPDPTSHLPAPTPYDPLGGGRY